MREKQQRRPGRPQYWSVCALLTLASLLVLTARIAGQEPGAADAAAPAPAEITVAQIQARIAALKSNQRLDEPTKTAAIDHYNQAIQSINRTDDLAALAQQHAAAIEQAPRLAEQLAQAAPEEHFAIGADFQLQPVTLPALPPPVESAELSATQHEQTVTQLQAELAAAKTQMGELETEPARRAERRRQIPDLIAAAKVRLAEIGSQLTTPPPAGEEAVVTEARRTALEAQQRAIEQEIPALENESLSYDARGQLLQIRMDQTTRRINRLERLIEQWREAGQARSRVEAEQAVSRTRDEMLNADGVPEEIRGLVAALAAENASLARRRTGPDGLLRKVEAIQRQSKALQERLESLTIEFDDIKHRVSAAGSTGAVGLMLRQQKAALQNPRTLRRSIEAREALSAAIQIELLELQQERREVADVERAVADVLDSLPDSIEQEQRTQMEGYLRDLFQSKRENLDALINDYEQYFAGLVDLDAAEKALLATTQEFTHFIDQRVLWIRSSRALSPNTFVDAFDALGWLLSPSNWSGLLTTLRLEVLNHRLPMGLGVTAFLVLLLLRPRALRVIHDSGEQAERPTSATFGYTMRALAATIVSAAPAAILCLFLGARLVGSAYGDDFSRAVGSALLTVSAPLFLLQSFRQLLRPLGIVQAHFDWPGPPVSVLRRNLIWAMPTVIVAFFVVYAVENQSIEPYKESLGRLSYLAALIALLVYAARAFVPAGGPVGEIITARRGEPSRRLRLGIRILVLALLIGLGVAAGVGYYYTTLRLSGRIFYTVVLVFGVLLVNGLILRWLLLARRRLARELALKRRAAQKAQAEAAKVAGEEGMPVETTAAPVIEESGIDLARVDLQSQRLLRTLSGLVLIVSAWFVWAAELPAFEILNRVTIGENLVDVVETRTDAVTGEEQSTVEQRIEAITLANVVIAIIIGLITFAGARNIPGVLEIGVLQRLKLPAGERNAVSTIVRYLIVGLGIVLAFRAMGIGWSRVQWLVAAIGVGLGFGLQEIFANFISGIILLFERPIRVGDVVTIGETSGKVTRIRIRATTIQDWDQKELVVPNKEFVAGKLINWTLSNEIIRIVIRLGIAYDSDVDKAVEVMTRVAGDNPYVLKNPAPQIVFVAFGESALNFEVRVFSPDLDRSLGVQHQMHVELRRALMAAGIALAFPQRDLHIRSISDSIRVSSEITDGAAQEAKEATAFDQPQPKPRQFGSH